MADFPKLFDYASGGKDAVAYINNDKNILENIISSSGLNNKNGKQGAPILIPASGAKNGINVHQNYAWTLSESTQLRNYIPKIILTEYKLTQSGQLGSLKLQLAAVKESTAGKVVASLPFIVAGIRAAADTATGVASENPNQIANGIAGGLAAGAALAAVNALLNLETGLDAELPYSNLYPVNSTGFVYTLPYLNIDNMAGTTGEWTSVNTTDTVKNLGGVGKAIFGAGVEATMGKTAGAVEANKIMKSVANALQAGAAASQIDIALGSPGSGVETIKAFAPNVNGDEISLTFYLYNTESLEDIQKNWNLLFLLNYQNLPNRRSINLLDPPCVYQVEIPGFKRFPIAAMTKFKVTNEGTTRLIDITTGLMPDDGMTGPNVKMIPEAYKVTITLKSLLMNTRNLFIYANDNSNRVNVMKDTAAQNTSVATSVVPTSKLPPGAPGNDNYPGANKMGTNKL